MDHGKLGGEKKTTSLTVERLEKLVWRGKEAG